MYTKYSDEDLIEAYTTMMDYSGKASKDMLHEIDQRGGMQKFLNQIASKRLYQTEIGRISKEVRLFSQKGIDKVGIMNEIQSELLSEEERVDLIAKKLFEYQAIAADRAINPRTISGSLLGLTIGSVLGAGFYLLSLSIFEQFTFRPLIGSYIICYLTIRFFTKQSRNNAFVFIASFLATVISALLALVVIK